MVKIGSHDETIFTKEETRRENSPEKNMDQLHIFKEGTVEYGFTNDYMFQHNSRVLAEIVRILLHLSEEVQVECEILNPIILEKQIGDQGCVLGGAIY